MSAITYDFHGRTAIVTGSARGVGREIAALFARSGATTVMVDVDEDELRAAADKIGGQAMVGDVASTSDVNGVVEAVLQQFGRIDVLVNNAGILRDRMVWNMDDADWDAVLGVHLGGTFRFTRACAQHFRERRAGRIVNVTSYAGLHGNPGQTNYSAAKAGIVGFTKAAAREFARYDVTVNAISPNADTRMIASIPDERRAAIEELIPLRRFAQPREMADAAVFLASDAARYITGVVLPVDGGLAI